MASTLQQFQFDDSNQTPTQYFVDEYGNVVGHEVEAGGRDDMLAEAGIFDDGGGHDFGMFGDPFAEDAAILGQQVPRDFQQFQQANLYGNTPMGMPGYYWGTGQGGLTPTGQANLLTGMTNQITNEWRYELDQRRASQARKDWLNLQLMLQREKMDAFKDAFSKGGTDEFDIKYPRGFETDEGQFAYHQDPEDLPAQIGLNIPKALPGIPKLPANMKQDFVGAAPGAAAAGQILNRIAGQGAQAGVDVGVGKLIEEVGKKQADLAAGADAAIAQQGVAGSRWVQDLREAISQVQNRAEQVDLGGDRLRQSAYSQLLRPSPMMQPPQGYYS